LWGTKLVENEFITLEKDNPQTHKAKAAKKAQDSWISTNLVWHCEGSINKDGDEEDATVNDVWM